MGWPAGQQTMHFRPSFLINQQNIAYQFAWKRNIAGVVIAVEQERSVLIENQLARDYDGERR